jgi:hypothetical protein
LEHARLYLIAIDMLVGEIPQTIDVDEVKLVGLAQPRRERRRFKVRLFQVFVASSTA